MEPTTLVSTILLGLGLAASSGLNTFLPLLMLAGAAHFQLFGVDLKDLNAGFAWLASDTALGVLGLATLVEVIGDKIPVVDHMLDALGTVARPAAGALAAASVTHGDPATAALVGIIVGAPTAFSFHTAKAGTRASSSAFTFGLGNPVLSFIEDVLAFGLTLIAFLAPWLVPLLLLVMFLCIWKLYRSIRRRLSRE